MISYKIEYLTSVFHETSSKYIFDQLKACYQEEIEQELVNIFGSKQLAAELYFLDEHKLLNNIKKAKREEKDRVYIQRDSSESYASKHSLMTESALDLSSHSVTNTSINDNSKRDSIFKLYEDEMSLEQGFNLEIPAKLPLGSPIDQLTSNSGVFDGHRQKGRSFTFFDGSNEEEIMEELGLNAQDIALNASTIKDEENNSVLEEIKDDQTNTPSNILHMMENPKSIENMDIEIIKENSESSPFAVEMEDLHRSENLFQGLGLQHTQTATFKDPSRIVTSKEAESYKNEKVRVNLKEESKEIFKNYESRELKVPNTEEPPHIGISTLNNPKIEMNERRPLDISENSKRNEDKIEEYQVISISNTDQLTEVDLDPHIERPKGIDRDIESLQIPKINIIDLGNKDEESDTPDPIKSGTVVFKGIPRLQIDTESNIIPEVNDQKNKALTNMVENNRFLHPMETSRESNESFKSRSSRRSNFEMDLDFDEQLLEEETKERNSTTAVNNQIIFSKGNFMLKARQKTSSFNESSDKLELPKEDLSQFIIRPTTDSNKLIHLSLHFIKKAFIDIAESYLAQGTTPRGDASPKQPKGGKQEDVISSATNIRSTGNTGNSATQELISKEGITGNILTNSVKSKEPIVVKKKKVNSLSSDNLTHSARGISELQSYHRDKQIQKTSQMIKSN